MLGKRPRPLGTIMVVMTQDGSDHIKKGPYSNNDRSVNNWLLNWNKELHLLVFTYLQFIIH
jgi:hypothetical protein